MKYIVVQLGNFEFPIIFPDMLTHSDVAGRQKVRSAGFCFPGQTGHWHVAGKSDSLNLMPRRYDDELLTAFMTGGDALLLATQVEPFAEKTPPLKSEISNLKL
jgi:hypothetical protein